MGRLRRIAVDVWGIGRVLLLLAVAVGTVPAVASGAGWAVVPSPNPQGQENDLTGVSCVSSSACIAVGNLFAERWDGANWAIKSTRRPGGGSLSGVSCVSARDCTSVGSYRNGTGREVTLAERWNGTRWAIQHTPSPGAIESVLDGVSCASASECIAVGSYRSSAGPGEELTLAERWNGTKWAIQPSPDLAGDAVLSGVSCVSASACTAVGNYWNGAGDEVTLAERWDGTRWTIQPTPNPKNDNDGSLSAVSCVSADACTAVGGSYSTLAERWDGTRWTIQPTPNPAEGDYSHNSLSGVSCASASACTAVGTQITGYYFLDAEQDMTLAERWDGTSWAIQPTPDPVSDENHQLNGVSCVSGSACQAVGDAGNSALIESSLWPDPARGSRSSRSVPRRTERSSSRFACHHRGK